MADDKVKAGGGETRPRSEGMPSGKAQGGPVEPRTKLEADRATGVDPHPGNVSDFSGQPVRAPKGSRVNNVRLS